MTTFRVYPIPNSDLGMKNFKERILKNTPNKNPEFFKDKTFKRGRMSLKDGLLQDNFERMFRMGYLNAIF